MKKIFVCAVALSMGASGALAEGGYVDPYETVYSGYHSNGAQADGDIDVETHLSEWAAGSGFGDSVVTEAFRLNSVDVSAYLAGTNCAVDPGNCANNGFGIDVQLQQAAGGLTIAQSADEGSAHALAVGDTETSMRAEIWAGFNRTKWWSGAEQQN